jgi:hypothetical protein
MILDAAAKSKNALHELIPRPCLYGRGLSAALAQ